MKHNSFLHLNIDH